MRKNKKARLLSMDELHTRPCEVDGKPALFHRWAEEDKALLRINCFVREDERDLLARRFCGDGIISPGCDTEVIRNTLALVEYPDGTIAKVKPELIRFVGEEAKQ